MATPEHNQIQSVCWHCSRNFEAVSWHLVSALRSERVEARQIARGVRSKKPRRSGAVGTFIFQVQLFDRFFGGLFALSIGFVQEPIDDARTALLLIRVSCAFFCSAKNL